MRAANVRCQSSFNGGPDAVPLPPSLEGRSRVAALSTTKLADDAPKSAAGHEHRPTTTQPHIPDATTPAAEGARGPTEAAIGGSGRERPL